MRSAHPLPLPLPALVAVVVVPLLLGSAVVVVAASLSGGDGGEVPRSASTATVAATSAPPIAVTAREVLATWDGRRAEAWASGDTEALADLYAPGSLAGRRDVAMLARWTERGLAVHDLGTQVLRLVVRRARPGRLVLDVTDRVTGAVAVGPGVRQALPADRASRRVLVLRREAGGWQVVAVRGAGAPAPASP